MKSLSLSWSLRKSPGPGPGPGPWHSSPCPCPGPWRKVLVEVLAVQFYKQNFALTPLWIHQQNYVENICTPASSAPVERVFSQSGLILQPHRAKMNDTLLETLVILKCNSA